LTRSARHKELERNEKETKDLNPSSKKGKTRDFLHISHGALRIYLGYRASFA